MLIKNNFMDRITSRPAFWYKKNYKIRVNRVVCGAISFIYAQLLQNRRDKNIRPSQKMLLRATLLDKFCNSRKISVIFRLQPFEEICKKSSVLWLLQEPVNEEKLNASNSMITNKLIDEYNNAAIKVQNYFIIISHFLRISCLMYPDYLQALKHSCVELWASSRLIAQGRLHDMPEGIELSPESLDTDVQLLLNMYCNDHMNHNDGTCCASSEPYTYLQLSAFVVLFVWWVVIEIVMEFGSLNRLPLERTGWISPKFSTSFS